MKLSLSAITQPVRAAITMFADMISNLVARVRNAASKVWNRSVPPQTAPEKPLTPERVQTIEIPVEAPEVKRTPLTPGDKLKLGVAIAAIPVALIALNYFFGPQAAAPLSEAAATFASASIPDNQEIVSSFANSTVLSRIAAPVCALGERFAHMAVALRPAMDVAPVASSVATLATLGSAPAAASLPAFEKLMETSKFFSELAFRNSTSL